MKVENKIEKATNEVKLTKKETERKNDEVIEFKEEIENEVKIENDMKSRQRLRHWAI